MNGNYSDQVINGDMSSYDYQTYYGWSRLAFFYAYSESTINIENIHVQDIHVENQIILLVGNTEGDIVISNIQFDDIYEHGSGIMFIISGPQGEFSISNFKSNTNSKEPFNLIRSISNLYDSSIIQHSVCQMIFNLGNPVVSINDIEIHDVVITTSIFYATPIETLNITNVRIENVFSINGYTVYAIVTSDDDNGDINIHISDGYVDGKFGDANPGIYNYSGLGATFVCDIDISSTSYIDGSNSEVYFYDIVWRDLKINSVVLSIDTSSLIVVNNPMPFIFKEIMIIDIIGDETSGAIVDFNNYDSYLSGSSTINGTYETKWLEFIDCEFRRNINFSIVWCQNLDYCNINFTNCIFDHNTIYHNDELIYNAFILEDESHGQINIFNGIFAGDYDSQIDGYDGSFIYNDTSNITFNCFNCTFLNSLSPSSAPSSSPTQSPPTTPTFNPTQTPSISPSTSPSISPTDTTQSPTDANSHTQEEFILNSDIKYNELTSLSVNKDNTTFNPGFRNMMKAKIDVELTNEFLVDLFSQSSNESGVS